MIDLKQSVQYIKGVGPNNLAAFAEIRNKYIRRFNNILSKEL